MYQQHLLDEKDAEIGRLQEENKKLIKQKQYWKKYTQELKQQIYNIQDELGDDILTLRDQVEELQLHTNDLEDDNKFLQQHIADLEEDNETYKYELELCQEKLGEEIKKYVDLCEFSMDEEERLLKILEAVIFWLHWSTINKSFILRVSEVLMLFINAITKRNYDIIKYVAKYTDDPSNGEITPPIKNLYKNILVTGLVFIRDIEDKVKIIKDPDVYKSLYALKYKLDVMKLRISESSKDSL